MALEFPKINKKPIKEFYEVGDELGRGAFSIVVEAVQKSTDRQVAIKIVDKKNTTPKQMYDELLVMSNLHHENIVEFVEMFNRTDGYYVVLERINGGELFDRIIELQSYSESEAVFVMFQALSALKHMHDLDYVHRDLKPENLLLSSKDPSSNIKIADFGFSAKMKPNGLRSIVGTPPYMAPELLRLRSGNKKVPGYDKKVDTWSIGIILYILLSGAHPFQLDDEEEMMENIEAGEWEWIGDEWENISDDVKDLIRHLMDPDPQTRYSIDQALEHPWITSGHTNNSPLTGAQEQIRKFQARKRFKGAIFSIMATNRLRRALEALKMGTEITEDDLESDPNEEIIRRRNDDSEEDE